ncbi:hypothetical protein BDR22DRAFT_893161 [Usnea florida]
MQGKKVETLARVEVLLRRETLISSPRIRLPRLMVFPNTAIPKNKGALREEQETLNPTKLRGEHPIGVARLIASHKIVYGSIGKDGSLNIRPHREHGHQTAPFAQVTLDSDIRISMIDYNVLRPGEKAGEKEMIHAFSHKGHTITSTPNFARPPATHSISESLHYTTKDHSFDPEDRESGGETSGDNAPATPNVGSVAGFTAEQSSSMQARIAAPSPPRTKA